MSDWAEPGAHPVAPGVHRVPLPLPGDGLRAVNVYLLDTADGIVMVDGGWALPAARLRLERAMASIRHDLGEIRRILVTHVHRDHYTQAVELRRLFGARVALGAGERHGLEMLNRIRSNIPVSSLDALRRNGADDLAERVARTLDDFDATIWGAPDEWLSAGELAVGDRTLRVIPTPGHTEGHVVFLDESERLLFAGDHVLPHITPSIGFELGEPGSPLADYLRSLRLMTTFADARLLPAHGPVADSTHARVADLLAHHDTRLAEAAEALGEQVLDAHAVARRLTWTRRRIGFADLDDFNRMLAVNETAAHLRVLVGTGRATVVTADGASTCVRRAASSPSRSTVPST
ncbi:MBL fold metallo-hydrolase [Saccharothrix deserti]|uniref:MBL fold metallo-hydrolase n=1 Tax=Saccharothrix deserti TaxID=2593674 RepID=UPI00131E6C3F|nr:MBL fold metallo-hydrolase [Saccharothrix deserti]